MARKHHCFYCKRCRDKYVANHIRTRARRGGQALRDKRGKSYLRQLGTVAARKRWGP